MKQALAIFTFSMMMSAVAFAEGGDMGGGRAYPVKLVSITTSEVEAFISKDGTYTTMPDLQDGLESLNGVLITPKKTILDISRPAKLDIESVILRNGSELRLDTMRATSGGDMGGG